MADSQPQPVVVVQHQPDPAYYGQPTHPPQANQQQYTDAADPNQTYAQPPPDEVPTDNLKPYGESEYGERLDFNEPQYRDKWWAIAWIIHLLIVLIILCMSIMQYIQYLQFKIIYTYF